MKIIEIPGSKSYTNRALIMAALANGKSTLKNISVSDDSLILIDCLKKLGIKIIRQSTKATIYGNGGCFEKAKLMLNIHHAGTAMRFLTALCALVPGEVILDGSERMRERPISNLVEALKKLGVKIDYLGKSGCPPLRILGGDIASHAICISGKVSSQFITALLLIAPVLPTGMVVKIIGEQISRSYINMTIDGLKRFGVKIINNNYSSYIIKKQNYNNATYIVEGDCSGASYFWGLAAISGKKIRVLNINPKSIQGDAKFPSLLKKMGCRVKENCQKNWVEVKGPKILKGIKVDMSNMPDTAQTLAVVAAFAEGKTTISGLKTLKVKETDRLLALRTELTKIGIKSIITNDSITVFGGKPVPSEIDTYGDHRMAMSFALIKAMVLGTTINNPEVVNKSFPDFWEKFNQL